MGQLNDFIGAKPRLEKTSLMRELAIDHQIEGVRLN